MIIFPAIDILDGTCVRLVKGDYDTAHKVAENPLETAKKFESAGASYLHMVDLDGAKYGKRINTHVFVEIAKNTNLSLQVGGGIRDLKTCEQYLSSGVSRVILGSIAVKNPKLVAEAVKEFGDKIIVGIDALNEMVMAEGWLESSNVNYIDLAKAMEDVGVKNIVFTDISKDGTLQGPNLAQLDAINKAVSCNIIASGGISNIDDIKNLTNLEMYGTICGKSLYKGTLDLADAIAVSKGGVKC
ncbi:MAG: 1-(5-phosphoribosyl)-5-[(5-phosphoribosylamino)methylideneamino]imidazole-4-carboxamide isomerase [Bacillota bacterium]